MDLAAHLGGMTAGEMLSRMSDEELDAWAIYNRLHGLTRHRTELYLAQIAYMQSDGKAKVGDFLLKSAEEPSRAVGAPEAEAGAGEVDMAAADFSVIGGGNVHYVKMPKGAPSWPAV